MTLSFTVPGPPVPWQRVTPDSRSGRHVKPIETRRYEKHVGTCAHNALVQSRQYMSWPRDARYVLSLAIYVTPRQRGDVSNILKAIEDGMQGIAYLNDHQIDWLRDVRRHVDRENPRVDVVVEVIE